MVYHYEYDRLTVKSPTAIEVRTVQGHMQVKAGRKVTLTEVLSELARMYLKSNGLLPAESSQK